MAIPSFSVKAVYHPSWMSQRQAPGPLTPEQRLHLLAKEYATELVLNHQWWKDRIDNFVKHVENARLSQPVPNHSGRAANISLKLTSKWKILLPFAAEERGSNVRTQRAMMEEAWIAIGRAIPAGAGINDSWRLCQEWNAQIKAKFGCDHVSPSHTDMEIAVVDTIKKRIQGKLTAVDRAVATVHEFLLSGGLEEKFTSHQTARAMEALKASAVHAFKHGGKLDDMITLLNECLVESTMES
jgi:hypothetical protein